MKKFIFKLTWIAILLIGLVYGLDYFIQEGLKKTDYREISKWNEVLCKNLNSEVLFIGSSRAISHFDTEMMSKELEYNYYNLGVNGSTFQVQDKVLELYLSKNKLPLKIYWIIDFHSFNKTKEVFRYEQFLPYSGNFHINSILDLNENINPVVKNLPIIRFQNNRVLKYKGVLSFFNISREEGRVNKGYAKPRPIWDGKFDEFVKEYPNGLDIPFDESIFYDFLSTCLSLRDSGVEIIWVIPPYYKPGLNYINNWNKREIYYREKSKEYGFRYLNYLDSDICNKKNFFYNASHLNKYGVEAFMKVFLQDEFKN